MTTDIHNQRNVHLDSLLSFFFENKNIAVVQFPMLETWLLAVPSSKTGGQLKMAFDQSHLIATR